MSSVKFSTEVQIWGILVAFSFNCLNFILFDDSTSLQVRENLLFSLLIMYMIVLAKHIVRFTHKNTIYHSVNDC